MIQVGPSSALAFRPSFGPRGGRERTTKRQPAAPMRVMIAVSFGCIRSRLVNTWLPYSSNPSHQRLRRKKARSPAHLQSGHDVAGGSDADRRAWWRRTPGFGALRTRAVRIRERCRDDIRRLAGDEIHGLVAGWARDHRLHGYSRRLYDDAGRLCHDDHRQRSATRRHVSIHEPLRLAANSRDVAAVQLGDPVGRGTKSNTRRPESAITPGVDITDLRVVLTNRTTTMMATLADDNDKPFAKGSLLLMPTDPAVLDPLGWGFRATPGGAL